MSVTRYRLRLKVKTVCVVSEADDRPMAARRADAPESAAALASAWLDANGYDRDREHFGIMAVDGRHRLVGVVVTSSGGHAVAPVDAGQMWRRALALECVGLIMFHTHPSGDLEPSRDDMGLTRRLVDGGHILGVSVYDHLILAPHGEEGHRWLSLRHVRPRLFEPSLGAAMSAESYT